MTGKQGMSRTPDPVGEDKGSGAQMRLGQGIIQGMLSRYIHQAMLRAKYKMIEDDSYFGQIPGLDGVWANERNLDKCRQVLQEVLEEWLLLKLRDGDEIPTMGRATLQVRAA